MKKILINFSGHKLSDEAKNNLEKDFNYIEEIELDTFTFSENVDQQIINLISKVEVKLDGSDPITIIPPGHSTISILLSAFIHGLIGRFPNLCLLELDENGVYMPTNVFGINTNKVRYSARKIMKW